MILQQLEVFMTTKELLGARIKELRKKRGFTQQKLSEIIEIDPKHLSRIEVGKSYPSLETLDKISKVLKMELRDFFEFSHQGTSRKEIDKTITTLLKEASPDILPIIAKVVRAIIR
jgi:transcriptional regulator with XRE-family HTH domain